MARGRIRAATTLLLGMAAGFLGARFLGEAPAPAPTPDKVEDFESAGGETDGGITFVAPPPPQSASGGPPSGGPSTLAEILRIDSDFEQTAALYQLINDTTVEQLQRLIEEADSVPGASDRRAALSILFARYADLDPLAALEFLQRRGGSYRDVELRAIFHAWSRSDLGAAVDGALALSQRMRNAAGTAILMSRDDLSMEEQRDVARRLGIEEILGQIAMQQSLDQVDRDPLTAWQAALAAGDGPLRHQRLAGIAQGWARVDPLAAMDAVMALSNAQMRTQLQTQILYEWGRRSPRDAVDWALAQAASPQRRQLTAMALSAMAESEPGEAFGIAQSLEGQERAEALGRVLSRWAADDPVAAARSLDTVTSADARRSALGSIAASYVRHDPDSALQWVATLNPEEAGHATVLMFSSLAHQDAAHAGSLISRLPENASREMAADSVVQVWVQQDPYAAAQWVDSLVDDQVRSKAAATMVGHWARFDRDAAVRYAERIPGRSERDAAIVSIIQMQHGDLDFAERMFDRLTEPDQRTTAARQLYFKLREADPQRAERYRELAGIRANPGLTR